MERSWWFNDEQVTRPDLTVRLRTTPIIEVMEAMLEARPASSTCPNCGSTRAQIVDSGLVGCPLCYAVHQAWLGQNFLP